MMSTADGTDFDDHSSDEQDETVEMMISEDSSAASPEQDARRKAAGERLLQIRKQIITSRRLARILAMQFIFQVDVQQLWNDVSWKEKTDFRHLVDNAYDPDEEEGQQPSQEELDAAWDYAELLIDGILECKDELDKLIAQSAVNWSLSRMGYSDRAILRLSAFEMFKANDILKDREKLKPKKQRNCVQVKPATSIDEAVSLAHSFGQHDSPRFINGVLDKVRKLLEKEAERPGGVC